MGRTTRRFEAEASPWAVMDGWAGENGFKLKHADDVRRRYQKGTGIGIAPIYVEMIYTKPWAHLQAWVGINILVRPGVLLFARREWTPESGGWRLSRSRRIARDAINPLFEEFGLESIR
ncbi:MAG: hypothetical protein IIC93_10995 [Chloroflexi bacterium]|nr:hypothetical protein [Chloroflexota bacterium]